MNAKFLGLLGALVVTCTTALAADDPVVSKWSRFELQLTSSVQYENPLQGAALSVIFTSPGGETHRVNGFWDGDKTWRARFSPNTPGKWDWKTTCSDASNKGLHSQSGSFTCAAPTGKGRFEEHGAVRVSTNGFTLQHDDATPFFWLADTAWNGALLSTPKDWQFYLETRVRQKFSAVQWVATQWRASRRVT